MAYSDSFPAIRPSFQFNADAGRLDPRISYTRSTTGTYFGTEKHLSSENLIKHSEGSAVWGGTATITYGYTNGPDGVTGTALRLESASGTERYRYSTGGQFVSGTAYTVNCWVKSNTGVAQTFRFMCSTTANQSANLTTHATDWTRVTATITPNTTNIFAGFVFLSANTNDISVWGLQVNTGSSALDYQATTTQIHREYAPTLQTAAINAPRFEHSATDSASEVMGQSRGLLIEGQSTNLNPYSDALASWGTNNALTLSANAGVGPDGSLGADLIVANTANDTHYIRSAVITVSAGSAYTFSGYFKSLNGEKLRLVFFQSAAPFTGEAGAVFTLTGSGSAAASAGSASITSVGNGYYRCTVTGTTLTTGSYLQIQTVSTSDSQVYVGNAYNGVLCAGIQFELGSFASSPIATNGSAVTRAADSASVATADIGLTAGQDVTLYADGDYGDPANKPNNRYALALQGTSTSYAVLYNGSYNSGTGYVRDGGTDQAYFPSGITAGPFKSALAVTNNSFKYAANGTSSTEDTAGTVPEYNALRIGCLSGYSVELNGHIKRVAVYGEALSDTNLQALTK